MKKLGFGMMRLPLLNDLDQTSVDEKQVCEMVDAFIANGFTYFDTAYMYHNHESERVVKRCLVARHKRDEYTLASKLPSMFLTCKEDNTKFFNEQLEKCGVDYFDYYLLHNLNVGNYEKVEKYNSFAFCKEMVKEGKIKHLGFSFHGLAKDLAKILEKHHSDIEFVQLQINYIDWENPNVESRLCYETVRKYGKKIVIMEPVKGGALANLPEEANKVLKEYDNTKSIPSYAIRFAASLDDVMVVLSGMSNMAQLQENMSYMKDFVPLTNQEFTMLLGLVNIINEANKIACTACNYCTEKCPKHICIPDYFKIYNKARSHMGKSFNSLKPEYEKLASNHGLASDCINCKQCEKMCPQHLPITKYLCDVATAFENKKQD